MISVLLVIGVRLYRDGLALALDQSDEIAVVGASPDVAGLAELLPLADSEVTLLLDVAVADGLTDLTSIATVAPSVPVLALGLGESTDDVLRCAEAGACGYVTREASIDELVAAVTGVARGEFACPPRVAAALMHRVGALAGGARQRPLSVPLSSRELEIVALIDDGLSNKQIASRLFITQATVKNHVHNILEKLGVEGRHEAAAWVRGQRLNGSVPVIARHAQLWRAGPVARR